VLRGTASEVLARVKALLENQFETIWVAGELSNVKKAPSGHWYFCLKDPTAQVDFLLTLTGGVALNAVGNMRTQAPAGCPMPECQMQ